MNKAALILEGGALRGIFSTGVLDCFMEAGIEVPYVVSVSAGTGNAMSFISKQPGRTKQCMLAGGKDAFYGPDIFLKTRKIMSLDRLFNEFPYDQFPFNFDAYFNSGVKHEIVVSDCEDGKPRYLSETESDKRLGLMGKASCSMPVFCDKVEIDGRYYLDGGLTDPIPAQHAIDMGYEKLVIVLTRNDGVYPDFSKGMQIMHHKLYKDYPKVIEAYETRRELYKSQIELVHKLEDEGKAFVIRPTEPTVGHFEANREKLEALYAHGFSSAESRISELKNFLDA